MFRFVHICPLLQPCGVLCIHRNFFSSSSLVVLFSREQSTVLSHLEQVEQGPSNVVPEGLDTSDTSSDETDVSKPSRRVRSNGLTRWRRCEGRVMLADFYDLAQRFCSKTQPFLLWHLPQRRVCAHTRSSWHPWLFSKHPALSPDRRLRLETPGSEILDYEGNPLSPAELGWQCHCIIGDFSVVRDRENPFSENTIVDEFGAVDPKIAVVRGNYELLQAGVSALNAFHVVRCASARGCDVVTSRVFSWHCAYHMLRTFDDV